jgi:hypothetical protein
MFDNPNGASASFDHTCGIGQQHGDGSAAAIISRNGGVFVTREHVRHNKSGIAHRGKTRISH